MRIPILLLLAVSVFIAAAQPKTFTLQYSDGRVEHKDLSSIKILSFPEIDLPIDLLEASFGQTKEVMKHLENAHCDFGLSSQIIIAEALGTDFRAATWDADHFAHYSTYRIHTGIGYSTLPWRYFYTQIVKCNEVLNELSLLDYSNEHTNYLRGQMLALRSYSYWWLVQLYAKPYNQDPYAPGVVILNETNMPESEDTYIARSTVEEVYNQMLADISEAISYLDDYPQNHACNLHPRFVISPATAYGLSARYHLTMGKYAEAAKDARKAIELSKATPLTFDEANKPGFNNIDAHNWMWGIDVKQSDRLTTTSILNFPSFVSSFADGYATFGPLRCCGNQLYDWLKTQENDVRLNWFLDSDNKTKMPMSQSHADWLQSTVLKFKFSTYINPLHSNVKFDSFLSISGRQFNPCAVPLMRIEEMYLIAAEGEAMSGDLNAAMSTLNRFVSTYRNPSYNFTNVDPKAIQTEIINQRRAEFWGEGLSHFDRLRLCADLDRRDNSYYSNAEFVIKGGSELFQLQLPATYLFTTDQNPEHESPAPGSVNN